MVNVGRTQEASLCNAVIMVALALLLRPDPGLSNMLQKGYHHKCAHHGVDFKTFTSSQDYASTTRPSQSSTSYSDSIFSSAPHSSSSVPESSDFSKKSTERRLDAASYSPIRIRAHYAFGGVSTSLTQLIQSVLIPKAIDAWTLALSVKPVSSPLKFGRYCNASFSGFNNGAAAVCASFVSPTTCGSAVVPTDWLKSETHCSTCLNDGTCESCETLPSGSGVDNADIVLIITALDDSTCALSSGSTLAWATPCQRDQFDRPILGAVNFCPSALTDGRINDALWEQVHIATAKHEIAHALGFTSESFGLMRDGQTDAPRTARDQESGRPAKSNRMCSSGYVKLVESPDSTTTLEGPVEIRGYDNGYRLRTPSVTAVAREHYQCSSLSGAEIENQPTGDSPYTCWGSHWEQRALHTELMSPVTSSHSVLSSFTLAFFEDTGWYKANYSQSESLTWGNKQGCDFLSEKCISTNGAPIVGASKGYFCTAENQEGCTAERLSKGVCSITKYNKALPTPFQYFQDPEKGGVVQELDFCPFIRAYSNGDCEYKQNGPESNNVNYRGEIFGKGSICFEGTLLRKEFVNDDEVETLCYGVACNEDGSSATVTAVRSDETQVTVTCTDSDQGSRKSMLGGADGPFSGYIICPDLSVVCSRTSVFVPDVSLCPQERNLCNGRGSCPDGKSCVCVGPFTGESCEIQTDVKSPSSSELSRAAIRKINDSFSVVYTCIASSVLWLLLAAY